MKPLLTYAGGKTKEIPRIMQHVPEQYDTYIEPFFGGGAVYFHLQPKKAIINDLNAMLINFYRDVARENYGRLKAELEAIAEEHTRNREKGNEPLNEVRYYKLRTMCNQGKPDKGDLLDSTIYYYLNKLAFGGLMRCNKKGEFNTPFGWGKRLNHELITDEHRLLLQGAKICNTDFSEIFKMASVTDFIFLDPPYDTTFTSYNNKNPFKEDEQRRLAGEFEQLACRALMVISKTPLIEELYGSYICEEYSKKYDQNVRNRANKAVSHVIIKNY